MILPDADRLRLLILLERAAKQTSPFADFALVGQSSQRRVNYARSLRARGYTVRVIDNAYGNERDELVASCGALLNVHANEQEEGYVFEAARCFRWIEVGFPVVSEPCLDALPPSCLRTEDLPKQRPTGTMASILDDMKLGSQNSFSRGGSAANG